MGDTAEGFLPAGEVSIGDRPDDILGPGILVLGLLLIGGFPFGILPYGETPSPGFPDLNIMFPPFKS